MSTVDQIPTEISKPLDLNDSKDEEISFSDFTSPSHLKPHEYNFMNRYLNSILKKRDHEKYLQELSPDVHKKILALKKLQLKTMDLSAEFHMKVHALEVEYLKEHAKIFEKRHEIINGNYVPSEGECVLCDDIAGISQGLSKITLEGSNMKFDAQIKGIPEFWLTVLKMVPQLDYMIRDHDVPVLKCLTDIKHRCQIEPHLSFTLEFHFAPNEYFENTVLSKEYFMKCAPEPRDPFSFDGPEIYKSKGTEIKWKSGKNVTMEKRDINGTENEVKGQSFFNFFAPPELIEDPSHPLFREVNAILEADFEIGFCLKDRVIPRAVLYFTGELKEDEDESSDSEMSHLNVVYENSDDEKDEE
uniref:CSON010577 protein n=1 Tax=Culicoides sonorensis TaxID=179676 RepID=A0A336M5M0_CULSO